MAVDQCHAALLQDALAFRLTSDTMTRKKLRGIREQLDALRRGQAKASDLISLAKKLGRKLTPTGKHSTYLNAYFPGLRPLSIPNHGGGGDLPIGTKNSIITQLDDDIIEWEQVIEENNSGGSI